ncbi:Transmembrane transcriptional regulator (Anti-sigma factor RsiW) [Pararobbsia alpina]|uniref:anti-sigma factor n=1 Tax=Pararobbsia alpina TaxID=621374 RepID=UPI0039A51D6C
MTLDDASLLAHVDGTLPPLEDSRVARTIEASADLSARVAMLEASKLPYASAFSQQALPALPDRVARNIDEMIKAHLAKAAAGAIAGDAAQAATDARAPLAAPAAPGLTAEAAPTRTSDEAAPTQHVDQPLNHPFSHAASQPGLASGTVGSVPERVRSRASNDLRWLAVAFVAGAFCWGVAGHWMPASGDGTGTGSSSMVATADDTHVSPWVAAAASYQQLYSRETVERIQPDMPVTAATVNDIQHIDDVALQIPDLSSQGLAFKRIQRLRFHGKPLVQIVYLPAKGAPIALCVLKEQQRADANPSSASVDGLDVVSWRRAGLGYALLGEHGNVDLATLGKQLYNGDVRTTLSRDEAEHAGHAI